MSTADTNTSRSSAPVAPAPVATKVETPAPLKPHEAMEEAGRLSEAGEYLEAIKVLTDSNRRLPKPKVDTKLARLRHQAFDRVDWPAGRDEWPPTAPDLFPGVVGPPEVDVADLTVDALTSGMVNHGCLLVRGLIKEQDVETMVENIDHAFDSYDRGQQAEPGWGKADPPWFVPFQALPQWHHAILAREWVRHGGGVLTIDSPRVMSDLFQMFEDANLRDVIGGYLGEAPIMSGGKCTLRRVPVDISDADWHQDGSFLGNNIRAVNVWVALTRCGGDAKAPGLDILPKRVDHLLDTGTEGAWFEWSISPDVVESCAVDAPIIRPDFEPGDALLFDDLFVHRTGLTYGMDIERYAIENWFFGASTYPGDQLPLVF